jgi:GNAT superfamily N-acetyltransferase
MTEIEIIDMKKEEINDAARVCSEAFLNTPFTKWIMGGTTEKHRKKLQTGMKMTLRLKHGKVMVAKDDGKIVGAMRMVDWPNCQNIPKGIGFFFTKLSLGKVGANRLRDTRIMWGEKDIQRPHCHIDPICVTPSHQGKGVGSKLLSYFNDYCDEKGIPGYFETDIDINVKFYEKNGFKVIDTANTGPIQGWIMYREKQLI